jgi:hypothetical protein
VQKRCGSLVHVKATVPGCTSNNSFYPVHHHLGFIALKISVMFAQFCVALVININQSHISEHEEAEFLLHKIVLETVMKKMSPSVFLH